MSASFGILGGTFDPPHAGHVAAATAAWRQLSLDQVRIIPAGLAPLRAALPLASAADRLAMSRLAFEPCPWAVIDDREVRREGVCWSVDTARELAKEFPQARRVWIIGADQLARLDRWKDVEELGRYVEFAVLSRDCLLYPSAAADEDRCVDFGGYRLLDPHRIVSDIIAIVDSTVTRRDT